MEARLIRIYRFFVTYWNAIVAGISTAGALIFTVTPPLQRYVTFFYLIGLNAAVWTLIEIKAAMQPKAPDRKLYYNMHLARPSIVKDIEACLATTHPERPLRVKLLAGRMRSMSDIVRQVYEDLRTGRARGHIVVSIYCMHPDYVAKQRLPGDVGPLAQSRRNNAISHAVRSLTEEMNALTGTLGSNSSIEVSVNYYSSDPYVYAYVIGDRVLYWGTFTWSHELSDLLGPESPCYRLSKTDPWFPSIHAWLVSRIALFDAKASSLERKQSADLEQSDPTAKLLSIAGQPELAEKMPDLPD